MFTHSLASAQLKQGLSPEVVIHHDDACPAEVGQHRHEGIPVEVLPPLIGTRSRTAVYGCEPSKVPGFDRFLCNVQPNLVHFHDFSVGANLLHMRAAKAAGCGIVLTYHSPGQFCTQRSLLYRGQVVCDGRLDADRCTRCRLGVLGVPEWLGGALSRLGPLGFPVDTANPLGRALTVRATVRLFERAWAECVSLVDRFTVHADWCGDVLRSNGVPDEKLAMVRSGWHGESLGGAVLTPRVRQEGAPLRIAFVGRADPVKGLHVLVDAVQLLPRVAPVQVSFFGPYWTASYGKGLLDKVAGDARFGAPEQLTPAELVSRLSDFDVCIVPSLWLETGPLVVLEAFAAGVPVIGSRLGGIAELVTEGVDGLLFKPGDSHELAGILQRLIDEPELSARLRGGIRPPRTMADVAREMTTLYTQVLEGKPGQWA